MEASLLNFAVAGPITRLLFNFNGANTRLGHSVQRRRRLNYIRSDTEVHGITHFTSK